MIEAMMKEEIASYNFDYCMRGLKKYGSLILTIGEKIETFTISTLFAAAI